MSQSVLYIFRKAKTVASVKQKRNASAEVGFWRNVHLVEVEKTHLKVLIIENVKHYEMNR